MDIMLLEKLEQFCSYNIRLSGKKLCQLINNETPKVLIYEDVFEEKVNEIKNNCNWIIM